MKISVLTPSVRVRGLDMVGKCLARQDFTDWEWIIVAPGTMTGEMREITRDYHPFVIQEPEKPKWDYYNLNKAWNLAYSRAKGDLIVNIVDLIWFDPDTLTRLWSHYQANPKGLISTIGHQYEKEVNGKPEVMVWEDPRVRDSDKNFFEVMPSEMEMCLCSIPRQAILDCGGLDVIYDQGAALGEKEMCWRLSKLGYKFFIDKSIEYRALRHPRLSEDWDEKYKITCEIFRQHYKELEAGTRTLNVNFIDK